MKKFSVEMLGLDRLLAVKKQSIIMMKLSGYDTTDDDPVLDYEVEDLEAYFNYVRDDIKSNAIRKLLSENGFLKTERCCFSTAYESISKPNHYTVIYFAPPPVSPSILTGKPLIEDAIELCNIYPVVNQEYCTKCTRNLKSIQECPRCTVHEKCTLCAEESKCPDCPTSPQMIERFIIVAAYPLSDQADKIIPKKVPRIRPSTGEWIETGQLVQVFLDENLLYNPLINSLKSSYKVLSVKEGAKLFDNKGNNITEHQIHIIDSSDMVCKYLGLVPGNIIRVERKQVIPGSIPMFEIIYRLVRRIPEVRKNRKRTVKKKPVFFDAVDEEL
jgi:DNA-directed RNA polymerase subunit H (RpoH/RPB5)